MKWYDMTWFDLIWFDTTRWRYHHPYTVALCPRFMPSHSCYGVVWFLKTAFLQSCVRLVSRLCLFFRHVKRRHTLHLFNLYQLLPGSTILWEQGRLPLVNLLVEYRTNRRVNLLLLLARQNSHSLSPVAQGWGSRRTFARESDKSSTFNAHSACIMTTKTQKLFFQ